MFRCHLAEERRHTPSRKVTGPVPADVLPPSDPGEDHHAGTSCSGPNPATSGAERPVRRASSTARSKDRRPSFFTWRSSTPKKRRATQLLCHRFDPPLAACVVVQDTCAQLPQQKPVHRARSRCRPKPPCDEHPLAAKAGVHPTRDFFPRDAVCALIPFMAVLGNRRPAQSHVHGQGSDSLGAKLVDRFSLHVSRDHRPGVPSCPSAANTTSSRRFTSSIVVLAELHNDDAIPPHRSPARLDQTSTTWTARCSERAQGPLLEGPRYGAGWSRRTPSRSSTRRFSVPRRHWPRLRNSWQDNSDRFFARDESFRLMRGPQIGPMEPSPAGTFPLFRETQVGTRGKRSGLCACPVVDGFWPARTRRP